jgi:hypothetical protein
MTNEAATMEKVNVRFRCRFVIFVLYSMVGSFQRLEAHAGGQCPPYVNNFRFSIGVILLRTRVAAPP